MSANPPAAPFDQARAAAFGERMLAALNDGALCTMTSVGHRTGLFDVMSKLPPSISGEIAAAAKLNERYVREWLGAMTTARVVEGSPPLYASPCHRSTRAA